MGIEADVVLRLGMMLMGAGTSGYRVLRAMKRTARAVGFDQLDAVVGVTQITVTFHRGEHFRTIVAQQNPPTVDASRIEALEDLTHNRLYYGISAYELTMLLNEIEHNVRKRWNIGVLCLAAAFACAAFALLNFFPWNFAIIVGISAACGQLVRGLLHRCHINQLGCIVMAGLSASLSYFLLAPESYAPGYIAAVLFLIPGFPLFSALIDLARFDLDAGISRLVYSLTIIGVAAFTVALISWGTGLSPDLPPQESNLNWYLVAAGASFVGIAGFAFLFNSSRRMVLVAALVGTIANMARLGIIVLGATDYVAAFAGGLIVGLLGAVVARWTSLPRITTTVPAAVIMIPGTAIFRSVYYFTTGQMDQALSFASTAMMFIVAIGCGLVAARMFSDRDWTIGRHIDFSRR
ncbi:threonine/serine exporter ThrE family protein [Corynebacterium kutscheri]|uniref:threonine/serine exporter ThrE family protein n=1 Tax=Corynebacterium kutscheri TaxID=35755 RepID=UPI0037BF8032